MKKTFNFSLLLAAGMFVLASCGGDPTAPIDAQHGNAGNDKEEHHKHGAVPDPAHSAPTDDIITEGQSVMFENLKDGDEVKNPVKVKMGVKGMTVKPAGEIEALTGHFHIIIDDKFTPVGDAVPTDETHIHYGKGQTETELNLTPGEHKLTLQFADGMHRSYGQKMSQTITVKVK